MWVPPLGVEWAVSNGDRVVLSGQDLMGRMGKLMEANDIDGLVELYASDAKVVRHSRVAVGHSEIHDALTTSLATHGHYAVMAVDQFTDSGDLVMWYARVETDAGILLTTHVVVLDADGLIRYNIPSIRGYWGM